MKEAAETARILRGVVSIVFTDLMSRRHNSSREPNDQANTRSSKAVREATVSLKTTPLKRNISVLLASASSGGTIAAARHLGAQGFDVRVISSHWLNAAAWSHHTTRAYTAPPENQSHRFLERLLAIGARDPGQVLLPTSDETAWLYAWHATELGQYFRIAQPSITVLLNILDKKRLADAASRAGLAVLQSWSPHNNNDLAELAPSLPYPVLIKPRTHVHRVRNDKGVVVYTPLELVDEYRRFVDRELTRAAENFLLQEPERPILQQFVSTDDIGVRSVTGFIDRTGELFVTRHAAKVFQRSSPVGVGVCFESRPPCSVLSNDVHRLCRELGYFGPFEVEFLWFDGRWAVIDFNPRLFSQVGLDIRRGMTLPVLACLDAAGEIEALREAVLNAQHEDGEPTFFCDRFTLQAILFTQIMTARTSRKDYVYWRRWMKVHAPHLVDFAADHRDPIPGLVHALSEIHLGLRSLPRFLRSTRRVSLWKS